jgi:hypothetical protein
MQWHTPVIPSSSAEIQKTVVPHQHWPKMFAQLQPYLNTQKKSWCGARACYPSDEKKA